MTIADEVRQLATELLACETRAAEIRRTLDEIAAALRPAVVKRQVPAEPVLDRTLFLRALASGVRETGELVVIAEASRTRVVRVLRELEAQQLVSATGSGSALRWHLTDLGVARLTGASPAAPAEAVRSQLRAVNL